MDCGKYGYPDPLNCSKCRCATAHNKYIGEKCDDGFGTTTVTEYGQNVPPSDINNPNASYSEDGVFSDGKIKRAC